MSSGDTFNVPVASAENARPGEIGIVNDGVFLGSIILLKSGLPKMAVLLKIESVSPDDGVVSAPT